MDLVGGDVDPRGGYFLKILYVKTKESGSWGAGGVRRARPLDPPMVYTMRPKAICNVGKNLCNQLANGSITKLLGTVLQNTVI